MTISRHQLLSSIMIGMVATNVAAQSVTWPTLAPGQTTYVIKPNEASLIIDTLYIPQGVTLQAGPGVQTINWMVNTLKFDQGATIDISALQIPPPVWNNVARPPKQADYCAHGSPGANGQNGYDGAIGADLTIRGITVIDSGGGQGSLWIRTDGGPGGAGGSGGPGQQGGGQQKFWNHLHMNTCHAGDGGPGGNGGIGGSGGRVANVTFLYSVNPAPTQQITVGVAAVCGPSQRPPAVQGPSGIIAVFGGVGCHGSNGSKGPDGGGG